MLPSVMQTRLALFFLLLFSVNAFAQDDEQNKTVSERVFIHTDKSTCVAGDTIWYKAYLFDGITPGSYSTNMFVELIDEKGIILFTHKLPVFNGTAIGNFEIRDSLGHGYYFLRAYTPQMLQQGKQIPVKLVAVLNPSFVPEKYNQLPAAKYAIQFFPENGELVAGLTNMVNAVITVPGGMTDKSSLLIADSKNDTVAYLNDIKDGIASFSFVPIASENYKATLFITGESNKQFNLPAVQSNGVLLSVADNSKGKVFLMQKTSDLLLKNEATLTGIMFDNIVFKQAVKFDNNESTGIIPLEKLPPGLLHLKVTDGTEKVYATRQVIITKQGFHSDIQFTKDTISFAAKGKNVITVGLPDSTEGNFSVSVTTIDNTDVINTNNSITNSVLLSAESVAAGINMQMLQPGKDKKTTNDFIAATEQWMPPVTEKLKPITDNYISIGATVYKYGSKKLLTKGNLIVMMRTKDSSGTFLKVPVDADGRIQMGGLVYDDTAKFHFQPDDKKAGKIELKRDDIPQFKSPAFSVPAQLSVIENKLSFAKTELRKEAVAVKTFIEKTKEEYKMLESVVVHAVRRKPVEVVNKKYASGMFSGMGNVRVFDFINEPPVGGAQNILQYLQGRVAGLRIDYRGGTNYSLTTSRAMSMTGGPIPVQIFLNEMPVDVSALLSVSIKDIALVKYFPAGSNAMFGFGVGGRLCIWTKQYDDYSEAEMGHDNYFSAPGYTASQQFIPKEYSKGVHTNIDNRKTLYWNPDLNITADQREVKIRFFNSDNGKKYKVVVQGYTYDGRLIDFEKIIE
jgi:hypothetical protein